MMSRDERLRYWEKIEAARRGAARRPRDARRIKRWRFGPGLRPSAHPLRWRPSLAFGGPSPA